MLARRRDERGAVMVLTAISMVFVVAAVAMSADVGTMIWRRRQLQAVADLASLDAVRALTDRRDGSQTRCAQSLTYAQQAALRNGFDYTKTGYSLSVNLGTVDASTKAFTLLSDCTSNLDPSSATAVKVLVSRPVPFQWLPGSNTLSTYAIAQTDAKAQIAMGTWLGRFNTSNSPILDKIIGCLGKGGGTCSSGAGVTVAGYSGLASATVTLGQLFTELGIGSTSEIANTTVTYKSFLNAASTVLTAKGDATSLAAASALTTMAGSADNTISFTFGDLIGTANESFAEISGESLTVLDLVDGAVELANAQHFFETDLPITIANVSNVHLQAAVIEAPQSAYGPARQLAGGAWETTVHTAQIRVQLVLTLTGISVASGLVPLSPLTIYVEGANGTGSLTNISCASTPSAGSVTVNASTNAVQIWIGQVSPTSAMTNAATEPTVQAETLANVAGVAKITALGSITVPGASGNVTMTGPFTRTGSIGASTVNTSTLANTGNTTVTVTVLGALGSSITPASVLSALSPVITAVGSSVLNVLSTLPLGLQFAGADLWNASVDCAGRRLVG